MTSEIEKLATDHADRISMHLEDEHNVTMIWHQAYEAYKESAKAVLEFARKNKKEYDLNVAIIDAIEIEDLEKFIEGEK